MEPIFIPIEPPIVWPAPPLEPRVRYVGQIRGAEDLKPPRKAFQGLGELLVGKEPPSVFYGPHSVVCTEQGSKLWIADPGGRCIHLLDLDTRTYTKIEWAGESRILAPVGLTRGPNGSVYVCDSEQVAIHRFGGDGQWAESLRLPEDVLRPVAAHFDEGAGELWVVDVLAHDVKVLTREGSLVRVVGRRGNGPGEFNFPCDIASDGETIWVVDTGNHRVQGLNRRGEPIRTFGQAGDGTGDLAMPKAAALDREGHVYVVDARFENVQVFDRDGRLLLVFGEEGTKPGEFWLPAGVHVDERDRIWVADMYNRRVQVFQYLRSGGIERALVDPGATGFQGEPGGLLLPAPCQEGDGQQKEERRESQQEG